MMKISTLLLFCFCSFSLQANNCEAYYKQGKILSSIQCFSQETQPFSQYNLAIMYSFVGLSDKADLIINQDDALGKVVNKKAAITDPYSQYDAADAISNLVQNEKVVMINESHHQPAHRVFTLELARKLREKGFTHLAMEGLSQAEKTQALGYATYAHPVTGFYTAEPAFAHLIKASIDMGYHLYSYEAFGTKSIEEREELQAQNLKALLDKEPEAKILVYAGYSHIRKTKTPRGDEWMARRFQKKTGITPFTVDQVAGTYSAYPELNDPILNDLAKKYILKSPAVFQNKSGEWLEPEHYTGDADMIVFHPNYGYSEGRPDWIKPGRHRYKVAKESLGKSRPVLVKAIYHDANEYAVPIDQFVLLDDEIYDLFLPVGKFRIEIETYDSSKTIGVIDVGKQL